MSKHFIETPEKITLHGLGFLQVKLGSGLRLHVWHPDLPKRKCFEHSSIHDHRFGFTSKVLIGEQVNQYYRVSNKGPAWKYSHKAYLHEGDRTKFGNRPWVEDFRCVLEKVGIEEVIKVGEEYSVSPYILHATKCQGVCVTLMRKTSEHNQGSHSYCEANTLPDVDFDRKQINQSVLWSIFTDAMSS